MATLYCETVEDAQQRADDCATITTGGTITISDDLSANVFEWSDNTSRWTFTPDTIIAPTSECSPVYSSDLMVTTFKENKMGVYRVYAVDRKKGSHSLLSFGEFVARNAENAKMAVVAQLGCNASSEDLDGDLSNVTDFDRWHWHAEKVFEFDVLED